VIRVSLNLIAVVAGVAWLVLSASAVPRSVSHLARQRHLQAPGRHIGPGIALLLLEMLPLAGCVGLAAAASSGRASPFRMPGQSHRGPVPPLTADQERLRDALRRDVETLAGRIGDRNALNRYESLREAADFIQASFAEAGHEVSVQEYEPRSAGGRPCRNIEVEIRGIGKSDDIVIVGAHYDSVAGSPGANDNATGAAAVLALARAFAGRPLARTLRLVAFVNEEPPFFFSREMGSLVYASRCRERKENIVAMISLETIGYYSDAEGSQAYPIGLLKRVYPRTGDFVGFVGNLRSRALLRDAVGSFRRHGAFPSEGAALPGFITGVGWSDHWSFWQNGYPAVMVTDTAPFRYPWYHTAWDTPDKINWDRYAGVLSALVDVVADLAGR
jgi:hypothetical protein